MQRVLILVLMSLLPAQYAAALGGQPVPAGEAGLRARAAAVQVVASCQPWAAAIVEDAGVAQDHGEHGSHCHHCQQPPSPCIADLLVPAILPPAEVPRPASASRHESHVPAVRSRPPRTRR